ncbi:hypothetical protein BDP27DRAFT_1492542 [Rhodocollybia butyracea]|uniref:Uncharacterized protein n=1 Tax=Rhodocollybia butyracea TaxID=206335 RepID=A0A9P5PBS0_9AGAR|nr:hypothetical protein BDP27DRAFT_1492542 [Rhodocollybia butyracea]
MSLYPPPDGVYNVRSPTHRITLTRLLSGDSTPLTYQAAPLSRQPLGNSNTCCACGMHRKTPQHVLLQCTKPVRVPALRQDFLNTIAPYFPLPQGRAFSDSDAQLQLSSKVYLSLDSGGSYGKYIHEVSVCWMWGGAEGTEGEKTEDSDHE